MAGLRPGGGEHLLRGGGHRAAAHEQAGADRHGDSSRKVLSRGTIRHRAGAGVSRRARPEPLPRRGRAAGAGLEGGGGVQSFPDALLPGQVQRLGRISRVLRAVPDTHAWLLCAATRPDTDLHPGALLDTRRNRRRRRRGGRRW